MLHSASSKQPKLDREFTELSPAEQEVDRFFSNSKNIAQLIKFLSLEEKKGKDKFNGFRFIMFKVCASKKYYVLFFKGLSFSLLEDCFELLLSKVFFRYF